MLPELELLDALEPVEPEPVDVEPVELALDDEPELVEWVEPAEVAPVLVPVEPVEVAPVLDEVTDALVEPELAEPCVPVEVPVSPEQATSEARTKDAITIRMHAPKRNQLYDELDPASTHRPESHH